MAKSIRSKVKKRNRSYMRATIGEKVRTASIEAASKRMTAKMNGRGNTWTLLATKGALNGVDLCKEYYEAVVRPSKESIPAPAAMDFDEDAQEEETPQDDDKAADADEEAAIASRLTSVVPKARKKNKKRGTQAVATRTTRKYRGKLSGTGVFSKRSVSSTRPPKQMVQF
mmetsp:Transcript_8878/g.27317  ORF Transcript_8878/g.27317 Transcript_8878/m.27317 type:complete len:170 (-) Transcript_8878:618-1127(-)